MYQPNNNKSIATSKLLGNSALGGLHGKSMAPMVTKKV
jgi:hypothetical protein